MDNTYKLRPLYLLKLLYELTDADHPLTTNEILRLLDERFSVKTYRARIAEDVEALTDYGFEIGVYRGKNTGYYLEQRIFEAAELKILIDAVQSSNFITERKSRELTGKLITLAPLNTGKALLDLTGNYARLKQSNEKIYYIVDTLIRAILQEKQVSFRYVEHDQYKRQILRHGGEAYTLSPYALVMDNNLYYVVGYYSRYGKITNFRVDRIESTPQILDVPIVPKPEDFDLDEYRATSLRMYNSEHKIVELACDFSVMDAIMDHFGEDVDTGLIDETTFSVTAETAVNHIFYSWVFGFGGKVRILEPREVLEAYADMVIEAANSLAKQF